MSVGSCMHTPKMTHKKFLTFQPHDSFSVVVTHDGIEIQPSSPSEGKIKTELTMVPRALLHELRLFAQRNSLADNRKHNWRGCCPNCLKAHAFVMLKEMKFKSEHVQRIMSHFPCSLGHNGYYLDGDKLISIGEETVD